MGIRMAGKWLVAALLAGGLFAAGVQPLRAGDDGQREKKKRPRVGAPRPGERPPPGFVHRHPRFGVVARLPPNQRQFWVGQRRYFYDGGRFYWSSGSEFMLIGGPPGFFLPELPEGFREIPFRGGRYACTLGTFYKRDPVRRGWVVVEPPVGLPVAELPAGTETVRFAGVNYFLYYGTFFRFDPLRKVHVVAMPPPGILVSSIPYDYEVETRDGRGLIFSRGVRYEPVQTGDLLEYRVVR